MQVFKAFFKILKKNIPQMLIYIVLFTIFSIVLGMLSGSSTESFTQKKAKVAIINEYENNVELIDAFKDCFSGTMLFVEIENDTQTIEDELFYKNVDCVITFSDNYLSKYLSSNQKLEVKCLPDTENAMYFTLQTEKYFKVIKTYIQNTDKDFSAIATLAKEDFAKSTEVEYLQKVANNNIIKLAASVKFNAYTLSIIIVLTIGIILLVFNKKELMQRSCVAGYSQLSVNFQKYLACFTLMIGVFLLQVLALAAVYPTTLFTKEGMIFVLYMFVYSIVFLSFAFMIGTFIKTDNAMSGLVNVVCLPMAFICGVFVPQYLLPQGVVTFSKFLPAYWYIRGIDAIAGAATITQTIIVNMLIDIAILLLFAAIFIVVGNIISNKKRRQS